MMNYEERYGERILSDEEERRLQEKLEQEEKIEYLEKCIERIKEILNEEMELSEKVSEIEYEIKSLE